MQLAGPFFPNFSCLPDLFFVVFSSFPVLHRGMPSELQGFYNHYVVEDIQAITRGWYDDEPLYPGWNPPQNFATPGRRPGLSRRATLNKRAESWSSSLRCARGSRKENRKTMDPTMKEAGLVVLPRRDGERWTASLPANGEYANLTRIYDSRGMHQSVLQDVILSLPYPCDEKFHLPLTRYFGGRCACPC